MNQQPVQVSQNFKDATHEFMELKSEIDILTKKLTEKRKRVKELNDVIITEMQEKNLIDSPIHVPNSNKKIRAKNKITVKPLNKPIMIEFFTSKLGSEETANLTIEELMNCRQKETKRVLEMCKK